MLSITAGDRGLCDGLSRRDVLHVGTAGMIGLSLPGLLRASAANPGRPRAKAKSLIVFFLEGGPAHQDLWDMKPDAPEGSAASSRRSTRPSRDCQFCEHLPRARPAGTTSPSSARCTTPSPTTTPARTTP